VKCGARVALGIAGGYLLGRTKKMKLALMVGGLAAGKRAGGPGQLLAQGTKLIGQSPELTRISDEIRGRLLDAGKAAAMAVATRQVEALTERMVTRVGTLTDVGGKTVGDVGDTVGDVGRSVADVGTRVSGRRPQDDDEYDDQLDDEYDDDVEFDDEAGDVPAAEAEEPVEEDEAAPAPEEEAPPPRRRTSRSAAGTQRAAGTAATAAAVGSAAGRATGRRAGRPARARQERGNG
jgi:hypothetical protein